MDHGQTAVGTQADILASADAEAADSLMRVRYRTAMVEGIEIFYREAGRWTDRSFCCCMAFRRPRICSAISFPDWRCTIGSSRPTIRAMG